MSVTSTEATITRQRAHNRHIHMEGFHRSDGLWDIEVTLTDVRDYPSYCAGRGNIAAGQALHDIHVCITVDNDLVVHAASATMQAHYNHTCPQALPPQQLGQCKAWAFDGPVVARIYPEFAGRE